MADHTLRQHTIGWIGTGRMGYAMAKCLLQAGCDVTVYNRTRAKAEPLQEYGAKVVDTPAELADRDIEILRLLGQGSSNQEIADQLFLSEKTVRNRLSLVFRQLHLKNRTEAALYAMRKGLATLGLAGVSLRD